MRKKYIRQKDQLPLNFIKDNRLVCYNCGRPGHMAKNCRKPRIECKNCRRLGHTDDKCPFSKHVNEAVVVGEPVVSKTSNHMFIHTAYINEEKTSCLVDTGSSNTLIRSSVVEKFNLLVSRGANLTLRVVLRVQRLQVLV